MIIEPSRHPLRILRVFQIALKKRRRLIIRQKTGNSLLDALPEREFGALLPDLDRVRLDSGQVVYEPGIRFSHVYFPKDSTFSFMGCGSDGETVELSSIGRESVTGMQIVLGADRSPHEMICTIGGKALRMPLDRYIAHIDELERLRAWTARCAASALFMLEQAVLCNRHHFVAMRAARWLLMTHDRIGNDEIAATQELLSKLIGAHRPAVNAAVGLLQHAGAISVSRGKITISDPEMLKKLSCECYASIAGEFADAAFARLRDAGKHLARSPLGVESAKEG